jgi:hypothetical protein
VGFDTTGEYDFEDSNLDVYNIYDYKKTDFYHGINREDEYYERKYRQKKFKRVQKWPTIQEFWESQEPHEFKVECTSQADMRKFKVWLRLIMREVASDSNYEPFDKMIENKYTKEI